MRKSHLLLLGLAAVTGLLVAWLALPTQLGGRTAYAVVEGSSMEPQIKRGNLVITRAQHDYQRGDVVLYRADAINRYVLHRIVGGDASGYELRGDANDFFDPDHPSRPEVVGRMVLMLPAVLSPTEPMIRATVVGTGLLLLLLAMLGLRGRRAPQASWTAWPVPTRRAVAFGGAAACLLAGVALVWSVPSAGPSQSAAHLSASFSYAGPLASSVAYPDGQLRDGDPVYPPLVRRLPLRVQWNARGVGDETRVEAVLEAVLVNASGWRHRLTRVRVVDGPVGELSGPVDLLQMLRLREQFEDISGMQGNDYAIEVSATFDVTVGGSEQRSVEQQLRLRYDGAQLLLDTGTETAGIAASMTEQHRLASPAAPASLLKRLGPSRAALLALCGLLGLVLGTWAARGESGSGRSRVARAADRALDAGYAPEEGTWLNEADEVLDLARRYGTPLLRAEDEEGDVVLWTVLDGQPYLAVLENEPT